MGLRFAFAYALLAVLGLGAVVSGVVALRASPPPPFAPGAEHVVRQFLSALADGDKQRACRLFSELPACAYTGPVTVNRFQIFPAERTLDGIAVRVAIDGSYAEIEVAPNGRGGYRITDIVAAPSSFGPPDQLMV
jgi:hypothetical protein